MSHVGCSAKRSAFVLVAGCKRFGYRAASWSRSIASQARSRNAPQTRSPSSSRSAWCGQTRGTHRQVHALWYAAPNGQRRASTWYFEVNSMVNDLLTAMRLNVKYTNRIKWLSRLFHCNPTLHIHTLVHHGGARESESSARVCCLAVPLAAERPRSTRAQGSDG